MQEEPHSILRIGKRVKAVRFTPFSTNANAGLKAAVKRFCRWKDNHKPMNATMLVGLEACQR